MLQNVARSFEDLLRFSFFLNLLLQCIVANISSEISAIFHTNCNLAHPQTFIRNVRLL